MHKFYFPDLVHPPATTVTKSLIVYRAGKFLTICPFELRDFCVQEIFKLINLHHPEILLSTMTNRIVLLHLILDPTWYRIDIGSRTKIMPNILSIEEAQQIESIGRTFCFQVYRQRFNILSEIENSSDTETSCDDSFSLHDTSSDNDTDSVLEYS